MTELRSLLALVSPYIVIVAAMAFALAGVDATIISLVAGGCLAAIDPRRGQAPGTTVTTSSEQATVTTSDQEKPK